MIRPLALAVLAVFCLATQAQSEDLNLRWLPQDDLATGYRAYFAAAGQPLGPSMDLGDIAADAGGIASKSVSRAELESLMGSIPGNGKVVVAVSAYNASGESPRSNSQTMTLMPDFALLPDPQLAASIGLPMDFESYELGEDPVDWVDTSMNNSLDENDDVFEVLEVEGSKTLGTAAEVDDTHSHLAEVGSSAWSDYEFRGRMRIESQDASIGVTVFSDYPVTDTYYRLGYAGSGNFELVSHLDATANYDCLGVTDTGLSPSPNAWYAFRFQAFAYSDGTLLRAKVWNESDDEPEAWQAECLHSDAAAFRSGGIGVWAAGDGEKHWDDLDVLPLAPDSGLGNEEVPEPVPVPFQGTRMDFEEYEIGDDPSGWFDTARDSSMEESNSLFQVVEEGPIDERNRVFGTYSRGADIHSHFVDVEDPYLFNYEFAGRMRVSASTANIGVTLYSGYPDSHRYYRLEASHGEPFHLAAQLEEGELSCTGASDSGVFLESRAWQRFRFQAYAFEEGTRLRAKVWVDGGAEPLDWQIDCIDSDPGALTEGVPGTWASGSGVKYWDDLELIPLEFY